MEGVQLGETPNTQFIPDICIICQVDRHNEKLSSSANGRKRVKSSADMRQDVVSKRLKLLKDEDDFHYHM